MVVGDLATAVDVLVLGGGPGGYAAALRAAQLGKTVTLVDPGPPGGTCLHRGCIPAKALLTAIQSAVHWEDLKRMGGIAPRPTFDLPRLHRWKNRVVGQLSKGVEQLLRQRQVEMVQGTGWFIGENEARVEGEYGARRFVWEQCVIAVGASPAPWPGLPFDGRQVLTPGDALNLTQLPGRIAVVGADYVAAELAAIFAGLGVKTRLLIPEGQRLLPAFDPIAARQVQAGLRKKKVGIETKVADLAQTLGDDPVVVSVGLTPCTEPLDLFQVGVTPDEQGFIPVDDRLQTANPAVYAVGDVTGGPRLASLALKQGKVAAEALAGLPVQYAPQAVPRVVWTDPQVAAVGMSEAEAQAAGYEVVVGRFPLAANGRALTLSARSGFVQVVAEKESEALLGVTIVGPQAETLIGEACLALEMGTTLTDLAETVHPHLGLSELLMEAAEAALGRAIHIQ